MKDHGFIRIVILAEQGYLGAKFQLGYCYLNGIGTEVNKEKRFKLYNEATGRKDGITQINIDDDKQIVNDLDKINYWYQKATGNNSKVALYNLGKHYELGQGVYKNEIRAFYFYKKLADKGFIDAQYKVGNCYDHGIGVDVDKVKAFNLYEAAAKKGNRDSQKNLALLYEQGEGTKKSTANAIYWYKKAVKNGCQDAKENLNHLLSNNDGN